MHRVVERMDLSQFENAYSEEGGELYAPALLLKAWLYAYALGITSGRRLAQRIREDLGLRYLAGGAEPDNWALSAFRAVFSTPAARFGDFSSPSGSFGVIRFSATAVSFRSVGSTRFA